MHLPEQWIQADHSDNEETHSAIVFGNTGAVTFGPLTFGPCNKVIVRVLIYVVLQDWSFSRIP
jgi:hypothetical protein